MSRPAWQKHPKLRIRWQPPVNRPPRQAPLEAPQGSEPAALGPDEPLIEKKILFAVLVLVLSFVAPFLGGWGSLLSLLIIGFGLHQAWKMNSKQVFEVAGPFQVGQTKI